MSMLIVRYQFHDPNPAISSDLVELLKINFGGGVNFIAEGTLLIETEDNLEKVYQLLSPLFTFDDKLLVGELNNFQSLHQISRSRPALSKVV